MRNATNLRTFFLKFHYAFQETLCPVTLAHIRSLYFIQVYTFIPLINSAPFLCYSHILLYTNFFLCTLPRKIFFLSLMTLLRRICPYYPGVRIKRAPRENVRNTCFIDIKTKADSFCEPWIGRSMWKGSQSG